jgi:Flp pilus assembly protein TadD
MRSGISVPARIVLAGLCATVCLAAEVAQNSFDSLLASGVKLAQQERYAEAVEVFEKCIKRDPESFEAHYNLALALFALERFSEARTGATRRAISARQS